MRPQNPRLLGLLDFCVRRAQILAEPHTKTLIPAATGFRLNDHFESP